MTINLMHKMIISVIVLIAMAGLILGGIILPISNKIKKTSQEIYELRVQLEKKYQQALKARLTKNQIAQISDDVNQFSGYIFKIDNTLGLIQTMEQLAKKYNIEQKISSSNLDNLNRQSHLTMTIDVNGKYYDILNYINGVEKLNYFMRIESVKILPTYNANAKINDGAHLTMSVRLYVNR